MEPSGARPLRVGVIGLGLIAQSVHLPNLLAMRGRFEIVHVCDLSERLARAVAAGMGGRARVSTDWHEVCENDDVEAVIVLTPGAHGPQALAALEAGKHVFAEKPLCYTLAEADALEAAANRSNRVLQVGYMKMFDPLMDRARQELAALTDPRLIRMTVLHPSDESQVEHLDLLRFDDVDHAVIESDRAAERALVSRALGTIPDGLANLYSDVLHGSVIHQLSVLRGLVGRLPSRFSYAHVWPRTQTGFVEDEPPSLLAVGEFDDALVLELAWMWVPSTPEYTEQVEIVSRDGWVRLSVPPPYVQHARGRLEVARRDGDERARIDLRAGYRTGFVRELEHFHDVVLKRRAPAAGIDDVRSDLHCLQALTAAAARPLGVTVGGEAAGESYPS